MPDVTIIPSQDGPYLVSGRYAHPTADGRGILHLNPGCQRSAPCAGWQANPAVDRPRSSQSS